MRGDRDGPAGGRRRAPDSHVSRHAAVRTQARSESIRVADPSQSGLRFGLGRPAPYTHAQMNTGATAISDRVRVDPSRSELNCVCSIRRGVESSPVNAASASATVAATMVTVLEMDRWLG